MSTMLDLTEIAICENAEGSTEEMLSEKKNVHKSLVENVQ